MPQRLNDSKNCQRADCRGRVPKPRRVSRPVSGIASAQVHARCICRQKRNRGRRIGGNQGKKTVGSAEPGLRSDAGNISGRVVFRRRRPVGDQLAHGGDRITVHISAPRRSSARYSESSVRGLPYPRMPRDCMCAPTGQARSSSNRIFGHRQTAAGGQIAMGKCPVAGPRSASARFE